MFLMLLLKMRLRLFAATTLAAAMAALSDSAVGVSLLPLELLDEPNVLEFVQLGSEESTLHKMAKEERLIEETDPRRQFKDAASFADTDKKKRDEAKVKAKLKKIGAPFIPGYEKEITKEETTIKDKEHQMRKTKRDKDKKKEEEEKKRIEDEKNRMEDQKKR